MGEDGTPIYADYRTPDVPPEPRKGGVTWLDLMNSWDMVVADLQQFYNVTEPLVGDYPWTWFYALVTGLVFIPESRVYHLHHQK